MLIIVIATAQYNFDLIFSMPIENRKKLWFKDELLPTDVLSKDVPRKVESDGSVEEDDLVGFPINVFLFE